MFALCLLRVARRKITYECCFHLLGIVVDIINAFEWKTIFFLLVIENAEREFLCIVKTETTDRFSVVVIKQNGAVALDIAHDEPTRIHQSTKNCSDNMKTFYFFFSGDYLRFGR